MRQIVCRREDNWTRLFRIICEWRYHMQMSPAGRACGHEFFNFFLEGLGFGARHCNLPLGGSSRKWTQRKRPTPDRNSRKSRDVQPIPNFSPISFRARSSPPAPQSYQKCLSHSFSFRKKKKNNCNRKKKKKWTAPRRQRRLAASAANIRRPVRPVIWRYHDSVWSSPPKHEMLSSRQVPTGGTWLLFKESRDGQRPMAWRPTFKCHIPDEMNGKWLERNVLFGGDGRALKKKSFIFSLKKIVTKETHDDEHLLCNGVALSFGVGWTKFHSVETRAPVERKIPNI